MSEVLKTASSLMELPLLAYAVLGLTVLWFLVVRKRQPGNIPPYPERPYPIVGHIPMMRSNSLKLFQKWRKMTGQDIFSMKIGSRFFVVLNNWELMKEAFVKKGEVFSDRPTYSIFAQREIKNGGLRGIIGNNGHDWKEQRSVSMQILREFGMGKNWLAEKVNEEVAVYLDTISSFKGEPKDFRLLTNAAVSNVICAILIGDRFDLEDPDFNEILKFLNEQLVLAASTSLLNSFPVLQYLPGDYFKAKKLLKNQHHIINLFSAKFVEEAKDDGTDNFIGSYFNEINKKQKSGVQTSLDKRNLIRVISNLFVAGTETTSTTILWALMFAIHNPKAQELFYQEVMEFVGSERSPSMTDKPKMNYVNAFIMESQRLGSIVPLSLTHYCTETVELGGYTIPAGTSVIPNLDAVLKDEATWGDPLVFRPERFLDKDNKIIVPDQFIPFSIGRRYCMGESLARMELFLYLTHIFQRFHILPEDPNNLPPPEPIFGITSAPKAFKVRFVERDEERSA